MGNGQGPQGDVRRRRVQRLKKMILLSVAAWLILPVGLCIVLFARIGALEGQARETQGILEQIGRAHV